MKEQEHADLFAPPKGVRIIVVPCIGEHWDKGATKQTPMDEGYAYIARTKWRALPIVLGVLQWQFGAKPQPLTQEVDGKMRWVGRHAGALPPKYHLVSLPTRRYAAESVNVDFLCTKLRELSLLCENISWLRTGLICLPQICAEQPWDYYRKYAEPYLSDRFTVITGKVGTRT